jgi:hypothetical protein
MTYQGDPDRPRRRPQDYVRRDDGSWSVVPIVLVAALLLGLGYLLLGDWNTETGPARTTDGVNRPAATPPATNTPPATKP